MKATFHFLSKLLAIVLIAALTVPMSHGIEELFHDHHSEEEHCHVTQHQCSEEALANACHLSIYHGEKSACSDHDHFTHKEEVCELCLWAERHSNEGFIDLPLLLQLYDRQLSRSFKATQEKQDLITETNYLRGPPLHVS